MREVHTDNVKTSVTKLRNHFDAVGLGTFILGQSSPLYIGFLGLALTDSANNAGLTARGGLNVYVHLCHPLKVGGDLGRDGDSHFFDLCTESVRRKRNKTEKRKRDWLFMFDACHFFLKTPTYRRSYTYRIFLFAHLFLLMSSCYSEGFFKLNRCRSQEEYALMNNQRVQFRGFFGTHQALLPHLIARGASSNQWNLDDWSFTG